MAVTKTVAAVSSAVYLMGLFIFHSHLARMGVADFGIVAGRYFGLGVLFVIFAMGPLIAGLVAVISFRRSQRKTIGILVSAAACSVVLLCTAAVWEIVIDRDGLTRSIPEAPFAAASIPYLLIWPTGTSWAMALVSVLLLCLLLYLPLIAAWRMKDMPIAATGARLPLSSAFILLGTIAAAQIFSSSVPFIKAAFGGGYYGYFIVTLSEPAASVLEPSGPDRQIVVRLLHIDRDAIYLKPSDRGVFIGNRLFIESSVVRVPQQEVIMMRRIDDPTTLP